MIDPNEVAKRFSYHQPKHDGIAELLNDMREAYARMASLVVEVTPESREQSLAVTALEEAMFWTTAAIMRNQ